MKHIQPPEENQPLRKMVRNNFSINTDPSLKFRRYWCRKCIIRGHPEDTVRVQNLFPLPSENYENPIQLRDDTPHQWASDDEILEMRNTPEMEERTRKYHSIVTLFKYIRSRSLLCVPYVGGWRTKDQFQHIFLSSDPDNDELKDLIHDCFFIPWFTGVFLPEFAPEWTDSYLIDLEKQNGVIRTIVPVDVWWRATGNVIVQTVQPFDSEVWIETYPNFKQYGLSKVGDSHFFYLLNSSYYDPCFTSVPDTNDPMVIINLDISNTFGTLYSRLVLDVLTVESSHDYTCTCDINTDDDFDTSVYELKAGDSPEFMVFWLVTISVLTTVFKEDDNLDFDIGKTKVLTKGPTSDHVFELVKQFELVTLRLLWTKTVSKSWKIPENMKFSPMVSFTPNCWNFPKIRTHNTSTSTLTSLTRTSSSRHNINTLIGK